MNNIETEFSSLKQWYENSRTKKESTGCEAVLRYMLEHPEKTWFWSWEFIGKSTKLGDYLSHRAPARASDLAIHYPDLVEDRKIGKFAVYRLKRENIGKILEFLNYEN